MKVFRFTDQMPNFIQVVGSFHEESVLRLSSSLLKKGNFCKISIVKMGSTANFPRFDISVGDFTGQLNLLFGSSGKVVIGRCGSLNLDIRSGHDSVVTIHDSTTCNGARIVAINSDIVIGEDGLLSDEILIQGFDQHGIVDVSSGKIINNRRGNITIGRHCWIGRRVSVMPFSSIGEGSIIGACSVVTKNVEPLSLVVGNPAKEIKSQVTWSRPWTHLDDDTEKFLRTI